ncbi:MAG: phosphoglucosamine mutase, partial [candidate division Zixibacteria bacterium]|nr:phosphoglucosamine mutase [candidate division Zixibacteria bacterium]
LLGAALVLSLLAESKMSLSELVGTMPIYSNIKLKRPLPERFEKKLQKVENAAKKGFDNLKIDGRDGRRFDFSRGWFQIRKSNTEPIYRLIVETDSRQLTDIIKDRILNLLK